ncbi:MAG: hypothetical protein R3C61_20620 [Bacteroidia bacterium]
MNAGEIWDSVWSLKQQDMEENLISDIPQHILGLKKEFRESRKWGAVPPELVLTLLEFWVPAHADQLLFENTSDNLALLLYAKAYGKNINRFGGQVSQLLRDHKAEYEKPLVPQYPPLSLYQLTEGRNLAMANMPIIKVWVYELPNGDPNKILAVGKGVPEICDQVFQLFLGAVLKIYGSDKDFLNPGFLHVEVPGAAIADNPQNQGHIGSLPNAALQHAKKAISELKRDLIKLQRETGLIEVNILPQAEFNRISTNYQNSFDESTNGRPVIWAPNPQKLSTPATAFVPINKYPDPDPDPDPDTNYPDDPTISFQLHGGLLRTTAFQALYEKFKQLTLDQLIADYYLREKDFEQRYCTRKADKEAYDTAVADGMAPEIMNLTWPDPVELNSQFLPLVGTFQLLPIPVFVPRDIFYHQHVPANLKSLKQWYHTWRNNRINLVQAATRVDSPFRRLVISRFLDMVLRQEEPDTPGIQAEFIRWRDSITPILNMEFRAQLESIGLAPERVFGPTTFFHSTVSAVTQTLDIRIMVNQLLFEGESVVVFNPEFLTAQIHDPLTKGIETTNQPTNANLEWENLQDSSDSDFEENFREALSRSPKDIISKVANQWVPKTILEGELNLIKKSLKLINQQVLSPRLVDNGILNLAFKTTHSGREDLSTNERSPFFLAKAHFLGAILEAVAAGIDPQEHLPNVLRNGGLLNVGTTKQRARIEKHIEDFRENYNALPDTEQNTVNSWLTHLGNHSIENVIRSLRQHHPTIQNVLGQEANPNAFALYQASLALSFATLGGGAKKNGRKFADFGSQLSRRASENGRSF